MKGSGTITKYFPFIEQDDQNVMMSILDTSKSYGEFVERLCQLVVERETSIMLAYMAANHAVRLRNYHLIDLLADKHAHADKIRPLILFARALRGESKAQNDFLESTNLVLSTYPENWLTMDMLDLKASFYRLVSVTSYEDMLEITKQAEQLLEEDEDLCCLSSFVYTAKGWALHNTGKTENVVEFYGKTLVIARKCDDLLTTAEALFGLRSALAGYDIRRELSILEEVQEIYQKMDHRIGESFVLDHLAEVYAYLGEFDKARDSYLESIAIKESVGLEHPEVLSSMSRLYASVGDADNALEYSRKAVSSSRRMRAEHPQVYFDSARALMLKAKYEEAFEFLETGGEITFRISSEFQLGSYYFHRGLLYRDLEDYDFAILSFRRALLISERNSDFNTIVKSLVRIAEANINQFSKDGNQNHLSDAELALARVEQIAREQNFQSLLVEIALLKSEIEIAYDEIDVAKQLLSQALGLCNSADLSSMKERVETRLSQLGVDEGLDTIAQRFKGPARRITIPSGLSKEIPFSIMGCLVIHTQSGLDVFSKIVDERLSGDTALISGVISAVSTFTSELTRDSRGNLQSIVHQDIAVILEPGENLTFALLVDQDTYEARALLRRFMEDFEISYGVDFEDWTGASIELKGSEEMFNRILVKRKY